MNDTGLLEAIDLELITTLVPRCEDDHVWYDAETLEGPPECAKVATARLIMSCSREVSLICKPLEEWLGDRANCTLDDELSHTRIMPL